MAGQKDFKYFIASSFMDNYGSATSYRSRWFLNDFNTMKFENIDDELFVYLVISCYRKPKEIVEKIMSIKDINNIDEETWLRAITEVNNVGDRDTIQYFVTKYEQMLSSMDTVVAFLMLNNYKIMQTSKEKNEDKIKKRMENWQFKLDPKMLPFLEEKHYKRAHGDLANIPKKYDKDYINELLICLNVSLDEFIDDPKIHTRLVEAAKYIKPSTYEYIGKQVTLYDLGRHSYTSRLASQYRYCDTYQDLDMIITKFTILIMLNLPGIKEHVNKWITFIKTFCAQYCTLKVAMENVKNVYGETSKEYNWFETESHYGYNPYGLNAGYMTKKDDDFIQKINALEELVNQN